ncbi:glycerophosphodiester phosphodiesterase family protein [Microbacterium sp.]|uniref:glycerophosphodiester phosphodiesterase family protein n=1 Tax=Microbacterium sp. TaxID=51671 RepID=UPI0025E50FDB|nr:glycerophosphodiester phosphodiesterase family protein [Microbacterium sp.]
MSRRRALVIGHRGAPGYRPEHSRSSYDLALALGVDAVEPDIVVSRDGVLVVRHDTEIGATTDVADRPEYADRHTTKNVDGRELSGWFVEDFTWEELATLRCRERLPQLRSVSATFDGEQPILRLRDVLDLVAQAALDQGREIGVVLEIKHATYLTGLGFDYAGLITAELHASGWDAGRWPLTIESFESGILMRLRERGVRAVYIYLLEAAGAPADLIAARGAAAPTYGSLMTPTGLDGLVGRVDGISIDKRSILAPDRRGRVDAPASVVADAHARGLRVYTWTCRPENNFLVGQFRRGRDRAAFGDYEAEWRFLKDSGVDGFFVDHADLGVAFFHGSHD